MYNLTLASTIKETDDVKGWFRSEKLDGYRATWDGVNFLSRGGNIINLPKSYINTMPKLFEIQTFFKEYTSPNGVIFFDGELWMGKSTFNKLGFLRKKIINEDLSKLKFCIFDVCINENFTIRYDLIKDFFINFETKKNIEIVKQTITKGKKFDETLFNNIIKSGGEGLMYRDPISLYITKRTRKLLKYKKENCEFGKVIGYKEGNNKYKGMIGSLLIETKIEDEYKKFYIGGLTDEERSIKYYETKLLNNFIYYSFMGLTKFGVPRLAVYKGLVKNQNNKKV